MLNFACIGVPDSLWFCYDLDRRCTSYTQTASSKVGIYVENADSSLLKQ